MLTADEQAWIERCEPHEREWLARHLITRRIARIESTVRDVRYQIGIAIEAAEVSRLHVSREKIANAATRMWFRLKQETI